MDIKTALQQHPFETKGKPGSELTVGTVLDLPPEVQLTFDNFEIRSKSAKFLQKCAEHRRTCAEHCRTMQERLQMVIGHSTFIKLD
jgi:hypothetical protein